MIEGIDLVKAFERNTRIVEMHSEGLSHADSLIQTDYNINCLNWVVGHMVHYRDEILAFLGHDRLHGEEMTGRYARESDPIREDGPGVLPIDELVAAARRSQERLAEVVTALTSEDFGAPRARGDSTTTLGAGLLFYYFHDTYHSGQTELLRQFAGVGDSII